MNSSSLTTPVARPAPDTTIQRHDPIESSVPMNTSQGDSPDVPAVQGPWHTMAVLLFLATALIADWLVPVSALWSSLDESVYRWLNGSLLQWGPIWQKVVAVMNSRPFDLMAGATLVGLLSLYIVRTDGRQQRVSWTGIALFAFMVCSARSVMFDGLVLGALEYERPSPTIVHADGMQLSVVFPNLHTKDRSPWSFPGDHGYYAMSVSLFLTLYGGRKLAVASWIVTLVCTLPRMISGAHWLSDILVGSFACSLLTLGAFLATPFGRRG